MEIKIRVNNTTGLHARPAALVVSLATKFKSRITARKADKTADVKSILDLLSLGICQGDEITLFAEGNDESEAIKKIAALIGSFND